MGLGEKTQGHVHQVWVEFGPSAEDVRAANLDCRACLSDMGTEFSIGDTSDVVDQCIGQLGQDSTNSTRFLYPRAFSVPGLQHIIDFALQYGFEELSWWNEWQRAAKSVVQWLHPANRRQMLQERVRMAGGGPSVIAAREHSLKVGCDPFAVWRWKTLGNVVKDLARMRDAVYTVATGVGIGEYCAQNPAQRKTFWKQPATQSSGIALPCFRKQLRLWLLSQLGFVVAIAMNQNDWLGRASIATGKDVVVHRWLSVARRRWRSSSN